MKKLLVLFLSAVLVLSMAAVSMAAATVEGDWRVEYTQDSSLADGADVLKPTLNDLRLNFKGKVSDTVDAYMQYTFGTKVDIKEWYVTFNQSFGKIMYGDWDYKLAPSRVLVKSHGALHMAPDTKNPAFLAEVPFADAFTFGLWFQPTLVEKANGYDVKLAYKADSFGAEIHYGDNMNTKVAGDENTYIAFDVYYNVNDAIKVFAFGTQAEEAFAVSLSDPGAKNYGKDGLDPIVGATFKTGQLTTSIEYDVTAEEDGTDEWNRYGLQLKYAFNNKVNLEVEYTNFNADGDTLLVIRPRVKF